MRELPIEQSTLPVDSQRAAELLVDIQRAAELLGGVSTKTVWSMTHPRGKLPVVRIGRRTMYEVAQLAEYAASLRQGGGQ